MNSFFIDTKIQELIIKEEIRQKNQWNLIASENICYPEILALINSPFTNKYAEGSYENRFYQGCINVNELEELCAKRACELFNSEYANVQAHCGSSANLIAYYALLHPGDTILSMDFTAGGHLSHGHPKNISSQLYKFIHYSVNKETHLIDYDEIENILIHQKPKLLISGASSYSRHIDYKRMYALAQKYNCYHLVDIAHVAGLIATNLHPSPVEFADIVTSTTQKTLRGPRGAFILSKKEFAKKIECGVMPGVQGGPFMNIIAAKAALFNYAKTESYKAYQKKILENTQLMITIFQKNNIKIISGGSDNHLFVIDTIFHGKTGKEVAEKLELQNIIVNKNQIPFDTLSPFITSGIRIGTPFITAQEKKNDEILYITEKIIDSIKN